MTFKPRGRCLTFGQTNANGRLFNFLQRATNQNADTLEQNKMEVENLDGLDEDGNESNIMMMKMTIIAKKMVMMMRRRRWMKIMMLLSVC